MYYTVITQRDVYKYKDYPTIYNRMIFLFQFSFSFFLFFFNLLYLHDRYNLVTPFDLIILIGEGKFECDYNKVYVSFLISLVYEVSHRARRDGVTSAGVVVALPVGISIERRSGQNDACWAPWTLKSPSIRAQFSGVGAPRACAVKKFALLQMVPSLQRSLNTQGIL